MSTSSLRPPAADREGRPLRRLLIALVLLTFAATIERLVGLSAPPPLADAPSRLRLSGYTARALSSEPPRQGRELSRGTLRRFRLTPLSGAPALTLTLLPVRSRTATDLSAETMGGKGLSLDTVASVVPAFVISDKRIVTLPIVAAPASPPGSDQVLFGRGPSDPAGEVTRLQTCLTPSGLAAVQANTLASAPDPAPRPGAPSKRMGRLLRLAGMTRTRHECLAVQLASASGQQAALEVAWRDLRPVLTSATTPAAATAHAPPCPPAAPRSPLLTGADQAAAATVPPSLDRARCPAPAGGS
jgi:hypothetical protein